VKRQILDHRTLSNLKLVTTLTVILLDHPPAVLNILTPLILRIVEKRSGNVSAISADTAKQERRQSHTPLRRHVRLRHAQAILRILLFTFVVNRRLPDLVFEETFVVV